MGFARVCSTR